tara:strand:+ start:201 stop:485 length:285 start_codon:yes stop_codon:yes gene_type:complete
MKITKTKLKQIIKEELGRTEEPVEKQVDYQTIVNLVLDENLLDAVKKYTGIEVADDDTVNMQADLVMAIAAVVGYRSPVDGEGFKIVTKRDWEF